MAVAPSTFSVLDNHLFAFGPEGIWVDSVWKTGIIEYNIETKEMKKVDLSAIIDEQLRIPVEGRALSTGDGGWILEDSTNGTIIFIRDGRFQAKWSNRYPNGKNGVISWSRYINPSQMAEYMSLLK